MFHFVPQSYPVYSLPTARAYPRYEYNPYSAYSAAPHAAQYDLESDDDDYDLMYSTPHRHAPRRQMLVDPFSMAAAETQQQRRQEAQRAAAYRHHQEQLRQQQEREAYENEIRRQLAEQEFLRKQAEAEMYERQVRKRQELAREREKQRELQRQRALSAEQEARRQEFNPLLDFLNLLNNNQRAKENPTPKTRSIPIQLPANQVNKSESAQPREEPKVNDLNDLIENVFTGLTPVPTSTSAGVNPPEDDVVEPNPAIESTERETLEPASETPENSANQEKFVESAPAMDSIEAEDAAEEIVEPAETDNESINSLHAHYTTHLNRRTALQTLASIDANFETKKRNFTLPENLTFQPTPPPSDVDQAEHHKSPTPKLAFSSNNHEFLAYEHGLLELLTSIDSVPSGGDLSVRKARKALVKKIEKELENLDNARESAWQKTLEKGNLSVDNLKDISIAGDEEIESKEGKKVTDSEQIAADLEDEQHEHDSDTASTLSVDSTPQTLVAPNLAEEDSAHVRDSKPSEKVESAEPNVTQTAEISV